MLSGRAPLVFNRACLSEINRFMKGFSSLSPVTVQDAAREIEAYAREIEDPGYREVFGAYAHSHLDRFADLLTRLEVLKSQGVRRVVDVGAYPGHLTLLMASRGFEVTALAQPFEGYPPYTAFLKEMDRRGVRVVFADIERSWAAIEPGSLDLAVFTEVIEHLRHNPFHAMAEICRWLAPGGRVWVSTPNLACARYLLRLLKGRSMHRPLGDPWPEVFPTAPGAKHEREYTAGELLYFLNPEGGAHAYGFEDGRTETRGWIGDGPGALGPRAQRLERWMVRLWPHMGSALFAEGRKPSGLHILTPENWTLGGAWSEPTDPIAVVSGPMPAPYPYPYRYLRGEATMMIELPPGFSAEGRDATLSLPWIWPQMTPPLPTQHIECRVNGGEPVRCAVEAAPAIQQATIPLGRVAPGGRLKLTLRPAELVIPDDHIHNGDRTPTGPALADAHASLILKGAKI